MEKEVIGYQIAKFNSATKKYDMIPDGMYSFVIFKYYYNAYIYLNTLRAKHLYRIIKIKEGDIEEPTFYEDTQDDFYEPQKQIKHITSFLHLLPYVSVRYINQNEGSIFFDGLVREKFLNDLKQFINAKSVCVTYLPAMIAKGVVVVFEFKSNWFYSELKNYQNSLENSKK